MLKNASAYYLTFLLKYRLAIFYLICMLLLGCGQTSPSESLIINNVTVIDATGAAPQPGRTVKITDGVIKSIQPVKGIIKQSGDTVIDASGMFLMPGFWDMHVHANQEFYLPLFIANGVTGVREMWGRDIHHEWRKRIGEEGFISPRFYIASSIIDGDPPRWPGSTVVNNAEQARKEVNRFYQLGSDFIKVYESLNRDAYYAIVDECKKLGITFVGHVPQSITFPEAISAGQKSIEHLLQFELYVLNNNKNPEELYQMFLENDTWSCPTITVHRNYAYKKDRKELDKDRLVYIPQPLADSWRYDRDPRMKNFSKNQWDAAQRFYENMKKQVTGMNKAGVRILAGTDVSNPYCFPGFSLHDEFALLVEAGLTPMQALQASTRNAAEFMGKLDTMGTVEEGKTADLVLLRANPLEDIHNTTKIEAVIFDGHLYERKDLDEMLENAKRAAAPGKTDALQSDKRFDGAWKGTVSGPDGNPLEITYEFESAGNNLSGYVSTKLGGGPFSGGKIEGNKISFTVERPVGIVYVNGILSGDVINMTQKMGDGVKKLTLKRVRENKKFDGTWKGIAPGPGGNPLDITYEFESTGDVLTGTVSTELGGGPFSGGKIDGNQISFYVETADYTIYTNGTLSGDMISMIQKINDEVKRFTVKRVTAGTDTAESALLSPDNSVIKEKAPFPGYLYHPNDNAAHPGILLLHGSDGGNGDFNPNFRNARTGENAGTPSLARDYARRGYVTYALCHFDCKHHDGYDDYPPDDLKDIDIYKITYEAF